MDNIGARVEIFLGAEAAEADRQHLLKVAEVEVSGEAVGEVQPLEPPKPTGPREISMEEKGLKFIGRYSKIIWVVIFAAFALVLLTQ